MVVTLMRQLKMIFFIQKQALENNGTILCDDYNLSQAPGVKQAIDEFIKENNLKSEIIFERFVKIEKK